MAFGFRGPVGIWEMMGSSTGAVTELRIPADPSYIVVAKRTAAGIASVAGFGVEEVDELNIAITQACERTIAMARQEGGSDGTVRLTFRLEATALYVDVRYHQPRAEAGRPAVAPTARPAPAGVGWPAPDDALDLALQMIGLFADDVRCRVAGNGRMHVRLAKYRWR